MRSDMTRLSIDVPKDLYKLIKYSATFGEQSIKDFVIDAIQDRLKLQLEAQQRELNELTLRTLQKADKGQELHEYERFDDCIAEMNEEG